MPHRWYPRLPSPGSPRVGGEDHGHAAIGVGQRVVEGGGRCGTVQRRGREGRETAVAGLARGMPARAVTDRSLRSTSGMTVLHAADAFWRPSNQMGVLNTDLAKQLGATALGARLWRLKPGQASPRHRHKTQTELYVVLEGTGRMRVGEELHTLAPLSAVLVEPRELRQVFNDTGEDALWLVVGAPQEAANTLEMTPEQLADLYPDGPKALPPELA